MWEERYKSALELHKQTANVENLNGSGERESPSIDLNANRIIAAIDKAEIFNIKIVQSTLMGNYDAAINAGQAALKMLDVELPETDFQGEIAREIIQVNEHLEGKNIGELLHAIELNEPAYRMILKLLISTSDAAYYISQDLFAILIVKAVNISLKYGHIPESSYAYSAYGFLLGSMIGNYRDGYAFGQLAVNLSHKFNHPAQKCQTCNMLGNFILPWVKQIQFADAINNEGYQAGLDSGELQFAGYILGNKALNYFYQGKPLPELLAELAKFLQFSEQTKNQWATDALRACQMALLNLMEKTASKLDFEPVEIADLPSPDHFREHQGFSGACLEHIYKGQIFSLYGEWEMAQSHLSSAENLLGFILGLIPVAEYNFYSSLCLTALYPQVPPAEQKKYLDKLEANQKQMRIWADNCKENFLHKYFLVAAEMARITGNDLEAIDLYDRAITAASEQEFIQNAALANELAAAFWLSKGKQKIARTYMRDAWYGYERWGATRKVEDLHQRYPQLLGEESGTERGFLQQISVKTHGLSAETRFLEVLGSAPDLVMVMKASQAISGEIVLDKLLAKLMKILLEHSGAAKGYLICESKDSWYIEAEAVADPSTNQVRLGKILRGLPVADRLPETMVKYAIRTRESVVLNRASAEGNFTSDPYIKQNQPQSIVVAPLVNQKKLNGIIYLETNVANAFPPEKLAVLNLLLSQAAISIETAQFYTKTAALNVAYERFVPRQFLQFLEKDSIVDVRLGDHVQKEMSILFSDIRKFTALSEKMSPEENFKFINSYLSTMEPAISTNNGFIDKYIGDAIMALFSGGAERGRASISGEIQPADDAVRAGIAMLHRLREYNQGRERAGYLPIEIGIGINTGSLMLGTIGGHNRMDSTVISDAVNLASRLEDLTKEYGVSLLISHQTFLRLQNPNQYSIRIIDRVKVKGKSQDVAVFEVFDGDEPELRDGKLATAAIFEEGLLLSYRKAYSLAVVRFEECLRRNPTDRVAQIYLERCQQQMS
ncbi:MAG TPA: GAF domain-containing protein [Oscillatoriaceae cyanobacterium M33_DOE_052]|uniref:GAF domain-containing protein n=1 Tax=Planktothricoides sp. SpSt-374 TaxID=2282167 RepID=A0A7C3ZX10_9CYAN|nr:GAF domain-containing protein [Oscillatoriaceae cyanobacterium M33_DOE_052]